MKVGMRFSGLSNGRRAFLRRIELAPQGAYRVPIRGPHSLAEKLEYTAPSDWLTAREALFPPFGMMGVDASAEFLHVISSYSSKHDPSYQLQHHL